jgi:SAM-dependent methyltransferase
MNETFTKKINIMAALEKKELEWTGERYVPQLRGAIALEHLHRYAFASTFVAGKDVLDIASGEGYGSKILSKNAKSVRGVDIDAESVQHANEKYGSATLSFTEGDACTIPLDNDSVDAVVSFETIEHVEDQETMLKEFKRVLRADGFAVISSPERNAYNEQNAHENPYHKRELDLEEYESLLRRHFRNVRMFGQHHLSGSAILPDRVQLGNITSFRFSDLPGSLQPGNGLPPPIYLLAICSDGELPLTDGSFCQQPVEETDFATAMNSRIADTDTARNESLSRRINEMQTSLSWRLTAPLRSLRDCFSRIGG